MTDAYLAQGWVVTFGGDGIDEIKTFDLGVTSARVEVTNHDSAGGTREYIAGLLDPSQITFSCNHVTSHAVFEAAVGDSSSPASLVMTSPGGFDYTVDAYVSGFTVHAPATGEEETVDLEFTTTGVMVSAS